MTDTTLTKAKAGILALLAGLAFSILVLKQMRPPTALPIDADSKEFSAGRALEHLKVVAKEPHSLGTPANDVVIDYVLEELKALGLKVSIQDTLITRTSKNSGSTRVARIRNIIGQLKGTANSKAVLLMAHHDSQPNTPGAADDGSGVVAIIETIRALKARGPLKNDLIVLVTDGEEIGLMGAKAFVDYHPLLENVGILINVEARGNRGLSMSFEMNPDNGWIIREFKQAAPHPFANSMAYEVYKVMPNDTDFSEFRETSVAGINSACVEGFVHYHSMTDTPENIDLDLLQHHGSNMLGMAAHFGNLAIGETKAPDAIFFNTIGSHIVIYPASYNKYFIFLAMALFFAVTLYGVKKDKLVLPHFFLGMGYFFVILAIVGIGGYLLLQLIVSLNPHYTQFYANNFYNVEYYFLGFLGFVGLAYALVFGLQKKLDGLSTSLGGTLMLLMALLGLTISMPTGTYLLYLPLIFYLSVQLVLLVLNINTENKPYAFAIGQFIALIPAIMFWSQMQYLLFETFGLTPAIIAPIIVFSFLGILTIPLIKMVSNWNKWVLTIAGLVVLLGGIFMGQMTNKPAKENPLQTHLIYGVAENEKKAVWATYKKHKNDWMQRLIPTENQEYLEEVYPAWQWKVWKQKTTYQTTPQSKITVISDSLSAEGERIIDLKFEFEELVNSMEFFINKGDSITNLAINDYQIKPAANPQTKLLYLSFFAPPKEGFNLRISGNNAAFSLETVDRIIGLPANLFPSAFPKNMIHGPGTRSNVQLIRKTTDLGKLISTQ